MDSVDSLDVAHKVASEMRLVSYSCEQLFHFFETELTKYDDFDRGRAMEGVYVQGNKRSVDDASNLCDEVLSAAIDEFLLVLAATAAERYVQIG